MMGGRLQTLVGLLRSLWVPEQAVRAEAWALGARHRGQVLEGAQCEARAPGVPFSRAILLQAVIRSQKSRAKLLRRPARP